MLTNQFQIEDPLLFKPHGDPTFVSPLLSHVMLAFFLFLFIAWDPFCLVRFNLRKRRDWILEGWMVRYVNVARFS